MAYDPRDPVTLAHGVDSFMVYTDERWANAVTSKSESTVPSSTLSWLVSVPTYLTLGDNGKYFKSMTHDIMTSLGFSSIWSRNILTDDKQLGQMNLYRFSQDGSIDSILPIFTESIVERMGKLFGDDKDSLNYYNDIVDDLPKESKIKRILDRALEERSFKIFNDTMVSYTSLLLTPLLYPFFIPQEKDGNYNSFNPWKTLWSDSEARNEFLRGASDTRYLSSNFFTSRFIYPEPKATIYEQELQNNRLSLTIPCSYWRSGACELMYILNKLRSDGTLKVAIQRGPKSTNPNKPKPTDPYGMRTLYLIYLDIKGPTNKLTEISRKFKLVFNSGNNQNPVQILMQVQKENLVSKTFQPIQMDANSAEAIVAPCDKENKWRRIPPQIYVRLPKPTNSSDKDGTKLNANAKQLIDDWCSTNGLVPHWRIMNNGTAIACYVSSSPDSNIRLDTINDRVNICEQASSILSQANITANIFEPITRISFWDQNILNKGQWKNIILLKIPRLSSAILKNDPQSISPTVRSLQSFVKMLLGTQAWSLDSSQNRKREMVLVTSPEHISAFAAKKGMPAVEFPMEFVERMLKQLIEKIHAKEPKWKPILEKRSPRDDRNDTFNLSVEKSIDAYKKKTLS